MGTANEISPGPPASNELLATAAAAHWEALRAAAGQLRRRYGLHWADGTSLVHRAYVKLAEAAPPARDAGHARALLARTIRLCLIDIIKKNGRYVPLDEQTQLVPSRPVREIVAVHEALSRLAETDPAGAAVVEMRYFGSFTIEEIGEELSISPATVKRRWEKAREWLRKHCAEPDE